MSGKHLNDISKVYLDTIANVKKAETNADIKRWEDLGGPTPGNYRADDNSAKLKEGRRLRKSDWRQELKEVIDKPETEEKAEKKVDEKKGIKNKIVINPTFKEAIQEIGGELLEVNEVDSVQKTQDDTQSKQEKHKKQLEQKQKKIAAMKKLVLRKKMQAVGAGGGEDITAGYELEGEVIDERLGGKGYSRKAAASSVYPGKKGTGDWEDSDRGAGNKAARRAGKKVEKKSPTYRAHVLNKEEVEDLNEYSPNVTYQAKGGKKSGKLGKSSVYSLKDKDESKKEFRKSQVKDIKGGYLKTEGYEEKKTSEVLAAFKRDPKVRKRFEKAAKKEEGPGSVKNRAADSMLQTAKDTAKRKGDTSKSDDRYAYEEVVHNEGVMKFIKDRVGGKKKPEKKASMDSTTDKLHTWRKSTSDKQKEHEKYVNFLPVDEAVKGQDTEMRKVKADERKAGTDPKNTEDPTGKNYAKGQRASVSWWKDKTKVQKEEVVTELNRYGKETGKATGSLNKRPGSPVATRNQPNSAVNIVRRNIIRPQTGRPEGQRKKVKGEKGRVQPGDRKFTPAQTISRMRAQVAAADAAMRDTRGT